MTAIINPCQGWPKKVFQKCRKSLTIDVVYFSISIKTTKLSAKWDVRMLSSDTRVTSSCCTLFTNTHTRLLMVFYDTTWWTKSKQEAQEHHEQVFLDLILRFVLLLIIFDFSWPDNKPRLLVKSLNAPHTLMLSAGISSIRLFYVG